MVVDSPLAVVLLIDVQGLFSEVTDELIHFIHSKHAHIYRLVCFYIGK